MTPAAIPAVYPSLPDSGRWPDGWRCAAGGDAVSDGADGLHAHLYDVAGAQRWWGLLAAAAPQPVGAPYVRFGNIATRRSEGAELSRLKRWWVMLCVRQEESGDEVGG